MDHAWTKKYYILARFSWFCPIIDNLKYVQHKASMFQYLRKYLNLSMKVTANANTRIYKLESKTDNSLCSIQCVKSTGIQTMAWLDLHYQA